MRLPAAVLATALLLAACSDGGADEARPTATPTPTSTSAAAGDPYEALNPPTSPGVGSYNAVLANRAYAAAHGFLALQLLEKPTLVGNNGAELVSQLQGATQDTAIARDLGGAPTRRGLDYRPLFAKGTTLSDPVATVTSSTYTADEVQGLGGEQGLRVSWTGTLVYPVTFQGKAQQVTYTLTVGYVFSPVAEDPSGLVMQQTVHGTGTAQGVSTACLAKGVLYPGPAAGGCPV
jgi:hypothetical protein